MDDEETLIYSTTRKLLTDRVRYQKHNLAILAGNFPINTCHVTGRSTYLATGPSLAVQ